MPEANQNGVVLGYRILYKKSHSQEELKENNVSAEVTATVLKNLSMYTEYNISILAYTSKGNGAHARFFTALTKEDRKSLDGDFASIILTFRCCIYTSS